TTEYETYTYDGEGNRLSKTESRAVKSVNETTGEITTTWEETGRTCYVMDTSGGYAQVIAELDENKEVKVIYTRGDGIISREEKSENGESRFRFYLSDGHGDVRQLTDETGEYYDEGTGLLLRSYVYIMYFYKSTVIISLSYGLNSDIRN
ncbi:MAG: hypothetical protein IJZ76_01445, partial [Lachnospiraceae bacterium]|nr:hypothetical protein [Lachnospiraceae bacterium]